MKRRLSQSACWFKRAMLAFVPILLLAIFAVHIASAQTYTYSILHDFRRSDGALPTLGLLRDQAGNLYGATEENTYGSCCGGTLFRITASGKGTILYSFQYPPEDAPNGDLIRDAAGNLYGTTQSGVVFKFNLRTRTETVLYRFTLGADGGWPTAGLVRDSAGNLYGVTSAGGDLTCGGGGAGCGTIFRLDASGLLTILHTFNSSEGGASWYTGLLMDTEGNLYGSCNSGIFMLDVQGNFTMLYLFSGTLDGSAPTGTLIMDSSHNLYGVTQFGGAFRLGTIYKFNLQTSQETVLHSFDGAGGYYPIGGLTRDPMGNLFGTTYFGGGYCIPSTTCGMVFELDTAGTFTDLHSFHSTDGQGPMGKLTLDSAGNLYGTTYAGGIGYSGVVFELSPN